MVLEYEYAQFRAIVVSQLEIIPQCKKMPSFQKGTLQDLMSVCTFVLQYSKMVICI